MLRSILLSSFSLLFLMSCQVETAESARALSVEDDFKWITVENDYQIKVPNDMETTSMLNENASLQQFHLYKKEYIIIIDESKQDFINSYNDFGGYNNNTAPLENFHSVQMQHLKQVMVLNHLTPSGFVSLKNTKAYSVEFEALIEKKETKETACYFVYHIEGKLKLYTVMGWTSKENKAIYREKINKMLATFTENNR